MTTIDQTYHALINKLKFQCKDLHKLEKNWVEGISPKLDPTTSQVLRSQIEEILSELEPPSLKIQLLQSKLNDLNQS